MKYKIPLFDGTDLVILILALAALVLTGIVLTVRDVEEYIAARGASPAARDYVPTEEMKLSFDADVVFDTIGLGSELFSGIRLLVSTGNARDLVAHDGSIYIATDGGLLECASDGEMLEHYTHLNGLLDNRLLCLAVWRDTLFAGSERGLVRLGESYPVAYVPRIPEGSSVTSLLPLGEDRLLVGTAGAGLLTFNGSDFRRDVGRLPGADFKHVTALADWKGQLVVGSREEGLFVQRGAVFSRLSKENGLPANHVTCLAADPDGEGRLLIATVSGLCQVDDSLRIYPWARPMATSAALITSGSTIIGTLDGNISVFSAGRRRSGFALGNRQFPVTVNRLVSADRRTWILSSDGAHLLTGGRLEPFSVHRNFELTDNHISALAVDSAGSLWIGYFDSGVEVLDTGYSRSRKLDDDQCRTVKCLYFDSAESAIYIGSSKGLVRIRPDGSREAWTTDRGLIGNEVNHVARSGRDIVAGTGSGLSFIRGERVRSIYAFHGLINNRVFNVLPIGENLYAGTLGGVSIVEGYQVVGHITPENSPLPVHWVTALCGIRGSLMVGTYGGGLALRRAGGGWEELPDSARGFEVNPNAMLLDGDLLVVGTLDRGLLMYHVSEGRWRAVSRGLSSQNVTALASDDRRLFVGTDNGVMIFDKPNL